MKLLIVTGMSGAGKSQAANALEDMGYYCVDNIPPSIIPAFVELSARGANSELSRLAIVTDIRGGEMFSELSGVLENLRKNQAYFKILFLDASNEVLINRYKENRRKHPLCEQNDITLTDAVNKEREILSQIRFEADYVVDTSRITSAQLKGQISDIFFGNINNGLKIQCKSFGFKYGADSEADMVFDVRCLPNPFYVDDLKDKTGIDKEVKDYVMSFPESVEFHKRMMNFIEYAIPLYAKEGKSQLVISIGCTGGKHRSVLFAEMLYRYLEQQGYRVSSLHRDIYK
ncbi:MAG: RNase adapter RapZ [Ruminococcaceae bacterium]|nr:RNase adapter RapZ [Oscillospiraceae bacterium]